MLLRPASSCRKQHLTPPCGSWEGARGEFGTGSASPLFQVFVREAWEQRWQWQSREMLGLGFVHTPGIQMSKALLLRVLGSENAQHFWL